MDRNTDKAQSGQLYFTSKWKS